jgi:hypothetical protein
MILCRDSETIGEQRLLGGLSAGGSECDLAFANTEGPARSRLTEPASLLASSSVSSAGSFAMPRPGDLPHPTDPPFPDPDPDDLPINDPPIPGIPEPDSPIKDPPRPPDPPT